MPGRAADLLRSRVVASRAEVVDECGRHAAQWAVESGQAVRALPRTLVLPGSTSDWRVRCAAALTYAGPDAAIARLTALRAWRLPAPDRQAVDVVVPHARRPRRRTDSPPSEVELDLRRSRVPIDVLTRDGLDVVTLERAVVESWPELTGTARRAPAIVAVRTRWTTPGRLQAELARHPRLRGRRELARLLELLRRGCLSELEVWGYEEVFTGPRFAHLRRQVPRRVGSRTVYLDAFDEAAMLAVELDGREYHDRPQARERDLARDAALAELGIQTLRFPHLRLVLDPAGCREQAWRVMQRRRQQLGA